MKSICDEVAARVALGEPLGDAAEHAADCPSCRALAALPRQLGELHDGAEPAPGFSARITAGASRRVAVRRHRRFALGAAALAATAALAIVVVTRPGEPPVATAQAPAPNHALPPAPAVQAPHPVETHAIDPDVKALVQLAETRRALRASANWASIERPLAPYRDLLEGVKP
jgi:hypothetical protein